MKKLSDFRFVLLLGISLIFLVLANTFLLRLGKVLGLFSGEVEVILVGDIMLGRSVMTKTLAQKDIYYPFLKVADYLKTADLVVGNLEAPFMSGCPKTDTGMVFCADPSLVGGLSYANIGVVNLANNHINNWGKTGKDETKEVLTKKGLSYVGEGNLVIRSLKGTKFGFLGFNYVDRSVTDSDKTLISNSKKQVDVLVVSVHWGQEYQSKAGKRQEAIAKELVKYGADVVVGHHPHWVQNVEYLEGKPVYYSLGNFVFDQMWSEETKKGMVVKLTFKDGKIAKEENLNIYLSSIGQPEFKE